MNKLTVYEKICRAARNGRGLRLTDEEIAALDQNHAVRATAQNDAEDAGRCVDCFYGDCRC